MTGFLTRERIVERPGWSRWLVLPPAALSIHLAIGQVQAWSAFRPALEKGLHIGGVASALPFTLGIVMLGLSAAVFGTKVDANGPRWAMVIATVCFVAGFLVSALGIWLGWYWLVVVGYGGIGGIGLGIGYISPVSTLIKWFPDRPGLSTGIAIMGFGGGALGPITVNAIADSRSDIVGPARYTPAFVVLIVLLVLGFVANELVRPVNVRWHEPSTREEVTV